METVADLIYAAAKPIGTQSAFKVNGKETDYRALLSYALGNAENLLARKGHRVGIYCKGFPEYMTSLYASLLTGIPALLLSHDLPWYEVLSLAKTFSVDLLWTDQEIKRTNGIGLLTPQLNERSEPNEKRLPVTIQADDDAIILMTSGTTGSRRAVPISHRNLVWTGREFNRYMGLSAPTREMVLVPLTHSFGVRRLIAQLLVRGCVLTPSSTFNPAAALQLMIQEHCETISAVPSHIRLFMGRFERDFKRLGEQIRFVELSSAFMSAEEKAKLVETLPCAEIVMGYGLTEATEETGDSR